MNQQNKYYSGAIVKEFNDEERSVVHFISTEDIDRHGDIVRADGMDTSNYNNAVLFGHDYNSFPVGKNLWVKVVNDGEKKGVLAKTRFNKTKEGEVTWELFKSGDLNSFSIGFLPKEWNDIETGYEFTKWELLEYSVVPVPANPHARVMLLEKSIDTDVKFQKIIKDQVKEFEMDDMKKTIEELSEIIEALKVKVAGMEEQLAEIEYVLAEDETVIEEEKENEAEIVGLSTEDKQAIVRQAILGAISQVKGNIQ